MRNATYRNASVSLINMPHDNATTRTPPPRGVFVSNTTLPDGRHPALPSLYLLGVPKAATTWMWECMHGLWAPEVMCDDFSRQLGCNGRRVLVGVRAVRPEGIAIAKGPFFFGTGRSIEMLHGPQSLSDRGPAPVTFRTRRCPTRRPTRASGSRVCSRRQCIRIRQNS